MGRLRDRLAEAEALESEKISTLRAELRSARRVVEAARRAKREAHGGHYAGCGAVSILTEALDAYDREEADSG